MNGSPRSRLPLRGIRLRDVWFSRMLRLATIPMPLLLALVLAHLAKEAASPASSTVSIPALLEGTLVLATVSTCVALPLALAGTLAARRILSRRLRERLSVVLTGLSAMPMVALGFLFAERVGPAIAERFDTPSMHPGFAALAMGCGLLPALWHRFLGAFDEVPRDLAQGGIALGASHFRVLLGIELPAALPAIARSIAEGLARCAGESVVVLMVSGNTGTAWGGGDGAAALAPALLAMMPEALPGSPLWAEAHRVALALVVLCVGLHVAGRAFRRRGRA